MRVQFYLRLIKADVAVTIQCFGQLTGVEVQYKSHFFIFCFQGLTGRFLSNFQSVACTWAVSGEVEGGFFCLVSWLTLPCEGAAVKSKKNGNDNKFTEM